MNLSNAARMFTTCSRPVFTTHGRPVFTTGSRPMVTTSRLGTSCPPGGGQVKVK
jgi:hypothetical protein